MKRSHQGPCADPAPPVRSKSPLGGQRREERGGRFISHVEEHRLALALHADVERVDRLAVAQAALGDQAPHVAFWVVARGINVGLHTRLYFADESAANAKDPVLTGIEWVPRRETLVAQRSLREGKPVYTFDIRVQGEGETVFFDV